MSPEWLARVSPIVHHAGSVRMGHGIINPWREIGDHELFLFDRGRAMMTVNEQQLTCDSPWFVIIPPATRHISHCLSDAVDIHWCHFNWVYDTEESTSTVTYAPQDAPPALIDRAPPFVPAMPLHGPLPSTRILDIHARLVSMVRNRTDRATLVARGILLEELTELLAQPETPREQPPPRIADPEDLRQALTAAAHRPFDTAPPIEEILTAGGGSYYHLERLFKERYDVSPHRYVSLIRLERARTLLRETDLPVSACARQLGYRDVGYFIRFFRTHVGMSPGRYRKGLREDHGA